MNRAFSVFGGIGGIVLGAGVMYWLDPQGGRRRRALVRDRLRSTAVEIGEAIDVGSRELVNRARGTVAEALAAFRADGADDHVITERVRARIGFLASHPRAIEVETREGRVRLTGDILREDVPRLISGVRRVRGVRDVDDRLRVHDSAGDVPALQGPPRTFASRAVGGLGRFAGAGVVGSLLLQPSSMRFPALFLGLGLLRRRLAHPRSTARPRLAPF